MHDIPIPLDMGQVERLRQGRLDVVGPARQMGGIFTQIDLRTVAVVTVVELLVMDEPTRCLVVMLIHNRYLQLIRQSPSRFIVTSLVEGSDRSDHGNLRIGSPDSLVDLGEAFREHIRDQVFVTDTDVFQVERLRMTCFGTFACPDRGGRIPVGIFHEIQYILNVCIHLMHRNTSLLTGTSAAGVLAGYTGCQDWYRFCPDVFTELEILEVTQTDTLVIVPQVAHRLAALQRTDGLFPAVDVADTVTMGYTTAREPYKAWMQIGQGLCQVGTQAILPSLEGVAREERNQIHRIGTPVFGNQIELRLIRIGCRDQLCCLLLPGFPLPGNTALGNHLLIRCHQTDP